MKELGDKTLSYHLELGRYINKNTIDFVLGIGKDMKHCINEINNSQIFSKLFTDNEDLVKFLKLELKPDDAIYLKASRSMQFENIIEQI